MDEKNLSLTEHLEELRRVLFISMVTVLITSSITYAAFGDQLFRLITDPLKDLHVELVYIGMSEAFLTKIKLSVLAGLILALPMILWQLWSFVAPALFPRERRYILLVIPLSLILFALGVAFAYFIVFNFAARFLLIMVSGDLLPMLSIGQYVSFLISFVIPFGVMFELPLAVYFLSRMGLIDHHWLKRNRKYAIFVIFVASAILTPPEVMSQILLAVPMLVLYEISVLISWLFRRKEVFEEKEAF